MMDYIADHPAFNMEHLGYLPDFISDDDPRSAREQFDANYVYGTNWKPGTDYIVLHTGNMRSRRYPSDPPFIRIATTHLRDETIIFFAHAYVAIVQPDSSFIVARMD